MSHYAPLYALIILFGVAAAVIGAVSLIVF